MNEEDILKDIAIESAKEVAKDVYEDAIQPTTKNIGGFFGTLSGFFNHVVMYPLKKLNIKYEQKAIAFEREMEQKYNNIPEQDRAEPELHIVGPTLESLKYNILDDDLAELFANLLISDMDTKTQNLCCPAFVKVIEQLSPNDAKVFKSLCSVCTKNSALPICEIEIVDENNAKRRVQTELTPKYVTDNSPFSVDWHIISKSIQTLERLGLVELNFLKWFGNETMYEKLKSQKNIAFALQIIDFATGTKHAVNISSKGIMLLTDFGVDFAKVCMRN